MAKPFVIKPLAAALAAFAFLLAVPAFAADAVVKPVPVPDLSKLPADHAKAVRDARIEFEKVKPTLVGDQLAGAYALLGSFYAQAGFYPEAAVALEDAAGLAPNDARWLYAQGIVARMQKQNAPAQQYFEKAFAIDPDYLPMRMAVVNVRMEQNDLDGAKKILTDFTAGNPKDAVSYAMLGEIELKQKRYAESIDATKKALANDPNATKLYAQLADAYTGAGNAKAAAEARAKVGDGVPALGDPIMLGLVQTQVTQAPAAPQPAAAQGSADTTSSGASQAAMRALTPAREAEFLLATGQYDAARQKLESAMRSRPNDSELLSIYARVEAADGKFDAAKTRAQSSVDANPKDPTAWIVLGEVLEMSKDDRGAQQAYERAIAIDSRSPAQIQLGNLLMRNGRYDDAAARYRALTQAAPGDADAWTRLMAAEVANGKCSAAIKELNTALAKDARNGILMQLFVRLTATCQASNAEEKRMALDYGDKLYHQSDAAPIAEAYALALAANGKWDDAVKIQQGAMFVLVRNGHKGELPGYRDFLQQFQAHKLPDKPWPAMSTFLRPERPAPGAIAAAQ
ncbi:MAG TPA: tetratricopeptide repeat protein [Rhodanobacteraceae bacterium]|nr:tetratricopeptide repeat protein [Rhodanobacteraceae bacterium]